MADINALAKSYKDKMRNVDGAETQTWRSDNTQREMGKVFKPAQN